MDTKQTKLDVACRHCSSSAIFHAPCPYCRCEHNLCEACWTVHRPVSEGTKYLRKLEMSLIGGQSDEARRRRQSMLVAILVVWILCGLYAAGTVFAEDDCSWTREKASTHGYMLAWFALGPFGALPALFFSHYNRTGWRLWATRRNQSTEPGGTSVSDTEELETDTESDSSIGWYIGLTLAIFLGGLWLGRIEGRIEGRFEGPRIVRNYMSPPMNLKEPNLGWCPAFYFKDDTHWHEGYGWRFHDLMIDETSRTVGPLSAEAKEASR